MTDPATEEAQERAEAAIDAASVALELSVLAIIAERLGKLKGATVTEVYASMPEDISKIRKAVQNGIKDITATANAIMVNMAKANDEWAAVYYGARNIEQRSAFTHSMMSQVLRDRTGKAVADAEARCRSTVIGVLKETADGKVVQYFPCEQAYSEIVGQAATAMAAGEAAVDHAVAQATRQLAQSGLKVRYSSGNVRNLVSSVRTNVMDAYRTAMSELREMQGAEFGADGVEVSAHALCAPDHQPYQGMRYSYERRRGYELWDDIQNQPARPLVTGANCGHTVFPVILGVTEPTYSRQQLRELRNRSNESVTFKGLSGKDLTMTRYEASQYQRGMETTIRKQKELAYLLDVEGRDAGAARAAARRYTREYRRVSDDVGLRARDDLIRVYLPK